MLAREIKEVLHGFQVFHTAHNSTVVVASSLYELQQTPNILICFHLHSTKTARAYKN
jgi:hypothetical protein